MISRQLGRGCSHRWAQVQLGLSAARTFSFPLKLKGGPSVATMLFKKGFHGSLIILVIYIPILYLHHLFVSEI